MKLFYLQHRETGEYLGRLLVTREGYVPTTELSDVHFCTTQEEAEEVIAKYPEFEVMCLGLTPIKVRATAEDGGVSIPGVNQLDVDLAVSKMQNGLNDLQALKETMFCELSDNGALSVYSDIKYDKGDDRIYIELEYPHS